MKKALIAGAASVAIAAMPVVGVFAVGHGESLTDRFTFGIAHQCSMTRVSHTAGDGTWNPTLTSSDLNTVTVTTLNQQYSLGSSTFNVKCNGPSGYEVNIAVQTLDNDGDTTQDSDDVIPVGTSAIAANGSITSSTWTISRTVNTTTTYYSNSSTKIAEGSTTTTSGDDFTVDYKLGLKDGQASGTYNGQVVYTLTDKDAS